MQDSVYTDGPLKEPSVELVEWGVEREVFRGDEGCSQLHSPDGWKTPGEGPSRVVRCIQTTRGMTELSNPALMTDFDVELEPTVYDRIPKGCTKEETPLVESGNVAKYAQSS